MINFISLSTVCIIQDSDDLVWRLHYSRLYETVVQGYFSVGANFSVRKFLVCISRLWRQKKLLLSHRRKLYRGSRLWQHPGMEIFSWQEDVRLAMDHGVRVRVRDALDVLCALGVHSTSGLGVGPFCKLQNVPFLEWYCILLKRFGVN